MNTATVAPYGSWESPITPEVIVADAAALIDVIVDGSVVWWAELRPQEGGRVALVRRDADGNTVEPLPDEFSVRTRVHEYGGAGWWVQDDTVWFTNWGDQRLWRLDPDRNPVPVTPEPDQPGGARYADMRLTVDGRFVLAVRELHGDGAEARNEIVAIPTSGDGSVTVLATGADFVAAPRPSPDGRQLCWLQWDHPNMPWDGTELWVGSLDTSSTVPVVSGARRVVGDQNESIVQPEWDPAGRLHFVSDRGNWWNVHRFETLDSPVGEPVNLTPVDHDIGLPAWVFGQSRYGFTPHGQLVCTWSEAGVAVLATVSGEGLVPELTPNSSLGSIRVVGASVYAIGTSSHSEPSVQRMKIGAQGPGSPAQPTILRPPRLLDLPVDLVSAAQPVEFPTESDLTAHAYYYAPTNPGFVAPEGELPPLLVFIHGGPTSSTSSAFSLAIQFWTSRGFAVVDVDYGGSSGHGRAYRERLNGNWGLTDVADCVNSARWLAERGVVDPERLAIRGGSAGGFTTLAALTFTDVFSAGASHYGVADLAALARDTHKFESRYLDGLVGPWPEAEQIYQERSPIHHTDRLERPLILLQGLEDEIVPPSQAEMMVDALREKGIPYAYVAFKGEQHGFRKAENIIRALMAELYFYSRVFGFEVTGKIDPVEIQNLEERPIR